MNSEVDPYCNRLGVAYEEKYAHLRPDLEAIAREHPEYGYRRTTVELGEAYGHAINHKVVQRLHQLWDLPLLRSTRAPKPSGIGQAKETFQRYDIPYVGMIIHYDQDVVFTGYGWTAQLLLEDGVRLSYALRGPQDNPEMEAFISRFKEENRSLFLDAQTLDELRAVVRDRMVYYNNERRHSRTEYLAPLRYVEMLQSGP